jgi:hypothetical protein
MNVEKLTNSTRVMKRNRTYLRWTFLPTPFKTSIDQL